MSEAYDFNGLLPSKDRLEQARKAHYDAGVIVSILGVIAVADISGGSTICGTMIQFLGEQLTTALQDIEEGCRL